MFSKHRVEELEDLAERRLHDQGRVPSFLSVYLYVSRSMFVTDKFTPHLRDNTIKRNFIRDGPELQNQVLDVFACEKFERSRRVENSFMLIVGNAEDGSVLWLARVLLPFRLNSQTDRGRED